MITLEDGRDVKFDVATCTMVPEEGDAVRLRVGPPRWGGGFEALHIEPVPSAAPTRSATTAARRPARRRAMLPA